MNTFVRLAIYLSMTTVLLVLLAVAYVLLIDNFPAVNKLILAIGIIISMMQLVILGEIIWAGYSRIKKEPFQ